MPPTALYVGIDVAKAQLDVAVRPTGDRWAIPNTEAGRQDVLARLAPLRPTLVLVDASGGLELPLVAALAAADLPVVVVTDLDRAAPGAAHILHDVGAYSRHCSVPSMSKGEPC